MAKRYSEKSVSPDLQSTPSRTRGPLVFVIASDRAHLDDVFSRCSAVPEKYTVYPSIESLMEELSHIDAFKLAFAVVVEKKCDTVDVTTLRTCKLDYPQLNYVLMLDECREQNHLRYQSLGVQSVILAPFDDVNLRDEIATALPNVPQFKRHPDLVKRGMARLDFLIPSELSYVLGVNYLISMLLREFAFPTIDCRINIPLACDEALTNAIIHGNRSDAKKKVNIHIYVSSSRFKMRIGDQGEGFDVKKVVDPTQGEALLRSSGRGVYLMQMIMDSVVYKEGGTVVELEKANTNPSHLPAAEKKS